MFKELDTDNSGAISRDELETMLTLRFSSTSSDYSRRKSGPFCTHGFTFRVRGLVGGPDIQTRALTGPTLAALGAG